MAWRPMKWTSVEEIKPLISKYFSETPREEWTITWLALALDTSRNTLCEYEWNDEFTNTIKKAKEMVENSYEIDLKKKGNTWTIFALKNFGWIDKIENDNKNTHYDATESVTEEQAKKIAEQFLKK